MLAPASNPVVKEQFAGTCVAFATVATWHEKHHRDGWNPRGVMWLHSARRRCMAADACAYHVLRPGNNSMFGTSTQTSNKRTSRQVLNAVSTARHVLPALAAGSHVFWWDEHSAAAWAAPVAWRHTHRAFVEVCDQQWRPRVAGAFQHAGKLKGVLAIGAECRLRHRQVSSGQAGNAEPSSAKLTVSLRPLAVVLQVVHDTPCMGTPFCSCGRGALEDHRRGRVEARDAGALIDGADEAAIRRVCLR